MISRHGHCTLIGTFSNVCFFCLGNILFLLSEELVEGSTVPYNRPWALGSDCLLTRFVIILLVVCTLMSASMN